MLLLKTKLLELNLRGTTYKKGMYVPVGYDDDEMLFGEIIFMLLRDLEVYFILRIRQSEFDPELHIYSLDPTTGTRYVCLQSERIVLKHAVSYDLQ